MFSVFSFQFTVYSLQFSVYSFQFGICGLGKDPCVFTAAALGRVHYK